METDSREEPSAKRPRTGDHSSQNEDGIPAFDLASLEQLSSEEFRNAYQQYQAVHFKASSDNTTRDQNDELSWKDIGSIYHGLDKDDQNSWCLENRGSHTEEVLDSKSFLPNEITKHRAYCSFLVQKDQESYQKLLKRLPLASLSTCIDKDWSYEPCLWIFFGRNNNGTKEPLEGRGLHTDSVSHDGTWHYQLSGTKEWYLTPSSDLLNRWKNQTSSPPQSWNESTSLKVACQQGDVIVVNTRLWFHRTVIPGQGNPSVSYARDFRLSSEAASSNMTNLDGLYARNEIEPGTVIFTENDMPDCELHRSKDDPNCEVVELENGTSAVVSKRTIACGEFFCVAESSDEEEEVEFVEEGEEVDDDGEED